VIRRRCGEAIHCNLIGDPYYLRNLLWNNVLKSGLPLARDTVAALLLGSCRYTQRSWSVQLEVQVPSLWHVLL
jgi:hypothetical protein